MPDLDGVYEYPSIITRNLISYNFAFVEFTCDVIKNGNMDNLLCAT